MTRGTEGTGRRGLVGPPWLWAVVGLVALATFSTVLLVAVPLVVLVAELRRRRLSRAERAMAGAVGGLVLAALLAFHVAVPRLDVLMDEELGAGIGLIAAVAVSLPLAVAAAVLAARLAGARRGHRGEGSLVAAATAGLRGTDRQWGAAMRAELATIERPGERLRFALGAVGVALRLGLGRSHLVLAVGLSLAAATFAVVGTRLAVTTGVRDWTSLPLVFWGLLVLATFVAAGAVALHSGSFRSGIAAGASMLVLPAAVFFTVAVPGYRAWFEVSGVSVSGNPLPPGVGLAFPWTWVVVSLAVWVASPVVGASAGALLSSRLPGRAEVSRAA